MELLKKHGDTVIVLGGILSSVFWMNHKFDKIEKEILIIKTVMLMQGQYPKELASSHQGLKE